MTLPLRRKHPITRPTTNKKASKLPHGFIKHRWAASVALAGGLLGGVWLDAPIAHAIEAVAPTINSNTQLQWRAKGAANKPAAKQVTTKQPAASDARIDRNVKPTADKSPSVYTPSVRRAHNEVLPLQVLRNVTNLSDELPNGLAQPASNESSTSEPRTLPTGAPRLVAASTGERIAAAPQPINPRPTPGAAGPIDDNMVQRTQLLEIDCDLERSKLKPIRMITTKIVAEPGDFPPECPSAEEVFQPRDWSLLTYTWKASNLCHKPLYFEQPRVERYGHALPPPLQPIASGAIFFATFPILPYKMGLELPNECIYSLGYYRPGSCAPYHVPGFPISARGAAFQATAIGIGIIAAP